jgi:ergothioneine biosynthesis protein EgtB
MSVLKSGLTYDSAECIQKGTTPPGALLESYQALRKQTELLTAPLSPEDQMVQSCPEASPAKWHLAHTTWFFETFVLAPHVKGYQPFHPRFRTLFNSYYNSVSAQPEKAIRNTFSRPSLEEVENYRRHTDEQVLRLLDGDAVAQEILTLVEMGIHHEQQHQELLVTDIKHAFWTNPLRPAYRANAPSAANDSLPAQEFHPYEAGLREIGASAGSFHFDNETPRHRFYTQPFRLAARPVTCGEYLAFMEDSGYSRVELWLSEGWNQVKARGWKSPLYWEESGQDWLQFTCAGMRKVVEQEPVSHVSFYEADAFARWAGARLPSEFEWEVAASPVPVKGNFLENNDFHPMASGTEVGVQPLQLFGDVWEWTASGYLPYPGYKPLPGAVGEYNGKFMCNQMVLRGGSCVTPASHMRPSYRNFFPPETRWQFSGIRLANDTL